VQVVIHDGEPADGDGKNLCKFLQSKLDPLFAVERFFVFVAVCFAQQKGASDIARKE
jgi:hypothetical protein